MPFIITSILETENLPVPLSAVQTKIIKTDKSIENADKNAKRSLKKSEQLKHQGKEEQSLIYRAIAVVWNFIKNIFLKIKKLLKAIWTKIVSLWKKHKAYKQGYETTKKQIRELEQQIKNELDKAATRGASKIAKLKEVNPKTFSKSDTLRRLTKQLTQLRTREKAYLTGLTRVNQQIEELKNSTNKDIEKLLAQYKKAREKLTDLYKKARIKETETYYAVKAVKHLK